MSNMKSSASTVRYQLIGAGFLLLAMVFCASVALAQPRPYAVPLTDGQISAFCASQGGCGAAPPPPPTPLVCSPGYRPNALGTGCEPIPVASTGNCAGFVTTFNLEVNWQTPTRLYQTMGYEDVIVVKFTTGAIATTTSLPRIAAAEYGSSPSGRIAVLSSTPCDFAPPAAPGAYVVGNSPTAVFAINGPGFGYYPVLQTNTSYYLNIKNSPNATCAMSGVCGMFVDLVKNGTI